MDRINKKVEYMKIGMGIFSSLISEINNNSLNESDFFRILGVVSEYIWDIKDMEYRTKSSLSETNCVWTIKTTPGSIQLNNE